MTYREADYPCVGICMNDPDTGYCIGCGRPPIFAWRAPPVLARLRHGE